MFDGRGEGREIEGGREREREREGGRERDLLSFIMPLARSVVYYVG
jgi:hypothetical protein